MLTIIFAIIILSFLMAIHELGHFLLAKLFNVKVEEFSIGLPPKILSIKKGEVVYALNAIPFGAYVKIKEDENSSDPRDFTQQATYKKILIFLGGIIMNFLFAFFVFLILFVIGIPQSVFPSSYVINPVFVTSSGLVRYPFLQAIQATIVFFNFIFWETLRGLKIAFLKIFTHLDVSDLLGPVGLVAITSRSFAYGWRYMSYLLALISYSLAIFNLLPIPALDGGRLLLLLIGKIFKKPISQKTESILDNIAFVLLIILAILVSFKDIKFFYLH